MTDWRAYQKEVATLFRELGCSADVEKVVRGVRAEHRIDIWVEFKRFGIEHRWAIECKCWKSPVPKEKVLTLKAIVDDVGADRGILVAESRFQPSAREAARLTNITLTTLADLKRLAKEDLLQLTFEKLERKAAILRREIFGFWKHEWTGPYSGRVSLLPGIDEDAWERAVTNIITLNSEFERMKLDHEFPAPVAKLLDGSWIIAMNLEEFVQLAGEIIEDMEEWVIQQKRAVGLPT